MDFRTKIWRYAIAVVFAFVLVSGIGQVVMSLGNVAIVHAIEPGGWQPYDLYHYRDVPVDRTALEEGRALLGLAERLGAKHSTIQWTKGRAALLGDDFQTAASDLMSDASDLKRNPIRYLDTLTAYSFSGADSSVIALYDRIAPPEMHAVISDTVALAYIRSAQALLNSNQIDQAKVDLQLALNLRPGDLYTLYQLWRLAANGSAEKLRLAREIAHFPAEAVSVRDADLVKMVFDVFPNLIADGLWEQTRGKNMIAYWVWQEPNLSELRSLLTNLMAADSHNATWSFYLGEIYDRLGLTREAVVKYLQAVDLGQAGQLALDRLGRLRDVSTPIPEQAAVENQQTIDTKVVAQMAGVPIEAVSIGRSLLQSDPFNSLPVPPNNHSVQNLVEGDTFRTFGAGPAQGWYWSVPNTAAWQFVSGRDPFERPGSVRITNLWWPEYAAQTTISPSASLISAQFTVPQGWALASMWYRVQSEGQGVGAIFVGNNDPAARLTQTVIQLPDTQGQWKRVMILGHMQEDQKMQAVLTNQGAANVWFQQVEVRPVTLPVSIGRCADQPCVMFDQN